MSNNLALSQLATNQASPETPINDMSGQLDAALTEILTVDLTGSNHTFSNTEYRQNVRAILTNAATTRTVGFPAIKRGIFFVYVDVTCTGAVSLVLGTTTLAVTAGRLYAVHTDGTANGLVARDIGGINEPHDIHAFVPGVMANAQLLFRMKATRAFTLPINLTGSFVSAVSAATGSTVITLKKNGTSIGTATFAPAATTATFSFAAAVSFAAGDVFTIEGPATADATLADTSYDLFGTR